MHKQIVAYVLQAIGSLAAIAAGFSFNGTAGFAAAAVVATVHGIALEREHAAEISGVEAPVHATTEKVGDR